MLDLGCRILDLLLAIVLDSAFRFEFFPFKVLAYDLNFRFESIILLHHIWYSNIRPYHPNRFAQF